MNQTRAATIALLLVAFASGGSAARADGYPHAAEPIGTVRQMYDGALTPDVAVNTFRNIDRLFATRTIAHGDKVLPLPPASRTLTQVRFASRGRQWDLVDYLAVNRVAALLVLKDGRIALELYQYGNTPRTRWMSMSIAKSITSTLIAAAVQQGAIASLDDGVTRYLPELKGSAYDGVSIRDILLMSSGVRWNETYTDPASDRRQMLEAQIAQRRGARGADGTAAPGRGAGHGQELQHRRDAGGRGDRWRDACRSRITVDANLAPVGMEEDANWWLDARAASRGRKRPGRDAARLRPVRALRQTAASAANGSCPPAGPRRPARRTSWAAPLDYGYMWWPPCGREPDTRARSRPRGSSDNSSTSTRASGSSSSS